jgi:hypothetical protein
MRTHHTAPGRELVIILLGDFGLGKEKSFVWMRILREQTEFFANLDGLRPPPGP